VTSPTIFLVDNGSLRPQATFALRALAEKLSDLALIPVEPVSLLHSHKIDPEDLGGNPATIVKRRMRELIAQGQSDFVILPLFLGPSLAITDYLPKVVAELAQASPGLRVKIAPPLAGLDVEAPDPRLAEALSRILQPLLADKPAAKVALVDHGTPIRPVSRLRDLVAGQLAASLGRPVQPCSMERREGPDYAFNDPLLENLGGLKGFAGGRLVLAMFFLLPGRHAGEGGDVATIADGLIDASHFDEVVVAPLLGGHPLLLEILRDRLNFCLRADPV
jgi:sirohydrochlorin ferrochelatase